MLRKHNNYLKHLFFVLAIIGIMFSPTSSFAKTYLGIYLDILAEYTLAGTAINTLLEESLKVGMNSEYNQMKAMSILRDWLKYKIPIDEKFSEVITDNVANYHDINESFFVTEQEVEKIKALHYDNFKKYSMLKSNLGTVLGNSMQAMSLLSFYNDTSFFADNLSKAVNKDSSFNTSAESYLLASQNVLSAYQTSISLAGSISKFAPQSAVASFWANNAFAKGLVKNTNFAGAILLGAQLESMIYKNLRDKQVTEMKDNIFYMHSAKLEEWIRILGQLVQLCDERENAKQPVSLGDLVDIVHTYSVLRPMSSTKIYSLEQILIDYSNNSSYLSANYGNTSFAALSDTRKIMVALDALTLMAGLEDADIQSYVQKTIREGWTNADVIFSALEGSSMYDIYIKSSEELLHKMFPYYGTGFDSNDYYEPLFKLIFNSGHAERKLARSAAVGRDVGVFKDAEDAANKPEYLEIQVPDKDVAIGTTQYNHTQFYATKGNKIRLIPHNDAAWPDFSAFNGAQIKVSLIPYNGINDRHLTLVDGTYVNGAIEFTIGSGTCNDLPMTLESGYIEVLGVQVVGAALHYSSPKQQITQTPTVDTFGGTPTAFGLVAKYDFENNANDSSGNGNNGTASGGVTYVSGVYGQAVKFGGVYNPGSVHVPNSNSLKFTSQATFTAWVRLDNANAMNGYGNISNGGAHTIIAKDHDRTGGAMWAYTNQSNFGTWFGGAGWTTIAGSVTNYSVGNWKHIAYVFDSTGTKLYSNGQLLAENLVVADWSNANTRDLYIGKFSDYWYPMEGAIDDLRVYNYSLSASDIQTIYSNGQIEILKNLPTATFLSENLSDGSYQVGVATKTWRFKSGANAITGLKAVQVFGKTASGLGISQTEIAIGDVAANTEFLINLPINPVHDTTDIKSSYWTLVDGNGQTVTITNSKNNDFWLKLHTNLVPEFSQLQLESVGGKTGQPICLPILVSDPDGDTLSYSVISGGGSVVDGNCMGTSGKVYQNNSPTVGVTPVTIRVTDTVGASADKLIYTVAINANGTVKDFFNDLKYVNTSTDQLKDQYRAINYLALKGIVIGLPDPNDPNGRVFEPNRAANQAEALSMLMKTASLRGFVALDAPVFPLANLSKLDPATGTYYNFSWAAPYVFKAEQLGLISSATGFEPNKEATREWFATILAALLKLSPPTDEFTNPSAYSFADASSFSTPYDYAKARAASFFGFMGQLGNASSFNPQSSMIRADVVTVVSKVLRRPTFSSIGFSGLTSKSIANENVLSVTMDQSFTVTGIGGLQGNRMLDDGDGNIKEDDLFNPDDYVTVRVIRPGMTPYQAGAQLAGTLTASPITVQSSPPDINYSQKRNLLVLLEAADPDGRNLVRNMGILPYGVFFPDRDGDGVRDNLDLWPDNPLYAYDANSNGIPDNADALWGLASRNDVDMVSINGQNMTLINAVLNGNLAGDRTPPATAISVTGNSSPYTVTLGANETATIRYTTDGTSATASSTAYTTQLNLTTGTKLSFYATDLAGNQEAVRTVTIQGNGDTTPPTINTFGIPGFTSAYQVAVTIDATDDVGITGWCLSENSEANGCAWSGSLPTSYSFASQGNKTLYLFVRDAANNSATAYATTQVTLPNQTLTVTLAGNGFGSVTSNPQGIWFGIACDNDSSANCSDSFAYGSTVSLHTTPTSISTFGAWGGDCSGSGACSVTMNGTRNVTATFNLTPKAMNIATGISYDSILTAIAEAATGAELQLLDTSFAEPITLGTGIYLHGGRNALFNAWSGVQSVLGGGVTLTGGNSTLENIDVAGKLLLRGGNLKVKGVRVR